MKSPLLRPVLFLVGLAVIALWSLLPTSPGLVPLALALFVLGGLCASARPRCAVTLTVSEILSDVLEAFKTRVPALGYFASDMSSEQVMFGQTVIAHLPTLPTVVPHVAATGYNANAQSARDLLTDVPIVINQWSDVQIKILAADATQDRSKNYLKTISNAGYVLGKAVVDFALTKCVVANFSQSTTASIPNTTKDTLNTVRTRMNARKAGSPRSLLCSSDFFAALDNDARISSGDYYGQRVGADPFGHLTNLAGFTDILEYPDFPSNSENLSAFGFDNRAIGIATRLPSDPTQVAMSLNIPITYKTEIVQDPVSGAAIAGYAWIDQNTHYIYLAASIMYGCVAGSQAGATGALTDYAGHRVTIV